MQVADTTAEDVLVYNLYRGDELLMTRSGTAETIERLRAAMEPLQPGFHATLGTGSAKDPIVAQGDFSAATAEERLAHTALLQAERTAALCMKMTRENLEVLNFSRTVVAELTREIAVARSEAQQQEEARWKALLGQHQRDSQRPLMSDQMVGQLGNLVQQLLAKGAKNG